MRGLGMVGVRRRIVRELGHGAGWQALESEAG